MTDAPLTVNEYEAQPMAIFAYRITQDPKPGAKVMHSLECGTTILYGLAGAAMSNFAPGITETMLTKNMMQKYIHNPDRIFEIHAPDVIFRQAPFELRFTAPSEKHGPLNYVLAWVPNYSQKDFTDSTENLYSIVIEPRGKDVQPWNDDQIEDCLKTAVESLNFRVTRFSRGIGLIVKDRLSKFFADLTPMNPEDTSGAMLKYFKTIRGPSGTIMNIRFKSDITKVYKGFCPKCLCSATRDCVCSNAKRGSSSTSEQKEAKRTRTIAKLAAAFD